MADQHNSCFHKFACTYARTPAPAGAGDRELGATDPVYLLTVVPFMGWLHFSTSSDSSPFKPEPRSHPRVWATCGDVFSNRGASGEGRKTQDARQLQERSREAPAEWGLLPAGA